MQEPNVCIGDGQGIGPSVAGDSDRSSAYDVDDAAGIRTDLSASIAL